MNFAVRLRQAVIEALRTNASMCQREAEAQAYLRPLQGLDQKLADWKDIPEDAILQACVEVCQKFVSTPENPRIGSWRYFDAAVRKAWKAQTTLSDSQQADKTVAGILAQMQQDYERGQG